jgi:hypothetical protein
MKRVLTFAGTAYAAALALTMVAPEASAQNPHDGQHIFRFDTFGDEQLWTDVLRMHEVIPSVPPVTALTVGLKVDSDALPPSIVSAIQSDQLDLNDPRVTVRLLELNAVVGVVGKVTGHSSLRSVGITCALCHSTVDNSVRPGIGKRLDGWPNRDLNVGVIVGLSPSTVIDPFRQEFSRWGPGRYDARHHIFDGSNLRVLHPPTSTGAETIPVVIPPAFGLQGVGFETYTGDGPISYWNAYVGITQMGGQGSFSDPRIGVDVTQKPDRITRKLPALLAYQLSLPPAPPPANSFDKAAATQGQVLFNGPARCAMCHIPPTYTDVMRPDRNAPFLHTPAEIGADPEYAARSATGMYRTTPLRGAWQHPPYFHDGSAATFNAVVDHYDSFFSLGLTDVENSQLVEFLKSL